MFQLKKSQKSVFSKLYRYYCTKLLSKLGLVVFYFLLFVFIIVVQVFSYWKTFELKNFFNNPGWRHNLVVFWVISLVQLWALWLMMAPLISYLVGRSLGWEELKSKQFFRMPKISRKEDIKVLIFTPSVERKTVIWAKFAAALTYFAVINFLLTLIVFACLLFTNFGVIASLLLLLTNSIGFALINYLLIIPYLFYAQEAGSFLLYLLFTVSAILLLAAGYFLRGFIVQYPIIFLLASVPFSILVGYLFFSLYQKKFLKSDLVS